MVGITCDEAERIEAGRLHIEVVIEKVSRSKSSSGGANGQGVAATDDSGIGGIWTLGGREAGGNARDPVDGRRSTVAVEGRTGGDGEGSLVGLVILGRRDTAFASAVTGR